MHYEQNLQKPGFTIENIDILRIVRDKNYRHSYRNGRHKHGFVYVVSGAMCDAFLDRGIGDIEVRAGELISLPKGSAYTGIYLEDHTEIRIVQFDLAGGTLPAYLSKPQKLDLPSMCEQMEAFFKPSGNHGTENPFYYLSCLYGLLWKIDEAYAGLPTKYKKLHPALTELSEHWDRNDPISHYAALCDMSEVNFRRLFRQYTGTSPVDYRNGLRLNHAQIRLQSGEYNVSEAAESCGFSNLSFFIRQYKRKFGYTPKKE